MPPGTSVLLYTDGLIERRDESLDLGLERLRSTAERVVNGTAAQRRDHRSAGARDRGSATDG